MMKFVVYGFLTIALTGCVTAPQTVWIRIDGQRQTGNPALTQEFEINRLSCLGDRQKADLSGVTLANGSIAAAFAAAERSQSANIVMMGCMADRGYLLVPLEQAEARLAAAAEAYAQRQKLQKGAEIQKAAGRNGAR